MRWSGKLDKVMPIYIYSIQAEEGVCCLGLTSISTIFQSYHNGVWLQNGSQCSHWQLLREWLNTVRDFIVLPHSGIKFQPLYLIPPKSPNTDTG